MKTFKKYLNQIINWYLFPYMSALVIVLPFVYFFSKNIYQDDNTWNGILIEAHGMIFDIIIIGILVTIISNRRERRLEIKRYLEEIDDYRGWESQEASQRISGIIRRINNRGKHKYLNLHRCCLTKADLNGANLEDADLHSANLEKADLNGANLEEADLHSATLKGANLYSANLKGANLYSATLKGANLTNANLKGADLREVNLEEAYLSNANLEGAHLSNANLEGAHLSNANLKDTRLNKANLEGAQRLDLFQLKNVTTLEDCTMTDGTKYNDDWQKKIDNDEIPEEYAERWKLA